MKSRLIPELQRLRGWRLSTLAALLAVLAVELLVSIVDMLLDGGVNGRHLLIGLFATGSLLLPCLVLVDRLLREISRQQQESMSNLLTRAKTQLMLALDSSDEGIMIVGPGGKVHSTNRRFRELWRLPPEFAEAGQDEVQFAAYALDQLADPEEYLGKVKQLHGTNAEARDTLRFKDGRVFSRYTRPISTGGEHGRVWCYKDITEQVRTELALAEREELYRTIVTQANDSIALVDAETFGFIEFNDATCAGLGYTREEFQRLKMTDILLEMDEEALHRSVTPVLGRDLKNYEALHRHKNGSARNVLLSLRSIQIRQRRLLVMTWSDITGLKRIEQELRVNERKLLTVLDNVDACIYLKDSEGRYLFANRALRELWQADMKDIAGSGDEKFFDAPTAANTRSNDRRVLENGEALRGEEINTVAASGKTAIFQTTKLPLRREDGSIYALCGISIDITTKRRMERSLNLAVEVTGVVLWELHFQTDELMFDRDMLPALGLEAGDRIDNLRSWIGHIHLDDKAPFQERIAQCKQSDSPVFDFEYRLLDKTGKSHWIHTRGRVIQRGGDGQPLLAVGTTTNIAARKQIEAAIRDSEMKSRQLASLLRLMCDNVSDMIWAKDLDKRYLFANKAICTELLNASDTGEPLGKTDLFFARRERDAHPDEPDWHTFGEICQDSDTVTLNRGGPSAFEESGNVKGKPLVLDVRKAPFYDENGKLIGTVGSARDISAQKKAEKMLLESETRLRTVIETEPECIELIDAQGRLLQINPAGLRMIEADTPGQVVGQQMLDLVVSEYRPAFAEMHKRVIAGESMQISFEVIGLKGGQRLLEMHAVPMPDNGGKVLLGVTRDITEQKRTEEQLHLAASVFTHAHEGIMITSADGAILEINAAFTAVTGYGREEVLGRNPRMFNSGRQGIAFYAAILRELVENGHWHGEVWNRRKNGEVYVAKQTVSVIPGSAGKPRQYVTLFSDITKAKEHEEQLERFAHYDSLTTLPNRVLLADRMRQAMLQAQRRKQRLAVAYLDLDGFKEVNDRHGHAVGDKLLMHVANRMRQALREGDTLARLGGDEFVAVLPDVADTATTIPLLIRLLDAAAQPITEDNLMLQVSASLGVTFYPQAGEADAELLLRQADQAMYQAKLSGKNRHHVYDAGKDHTLCHQHNLLDRLRNAMEAHEFELHYQPIVNMRDGTLVGAEALMRWRHPEKGLLLPAEFLPAIEDSPLALELGEWAIDSALAQAERWHDSGLDTPVSVNIGVRHLQQPGFVTRLREILAAHPAIEPSRLTLEVLENSALGNIAQVSEVMENCRELGVFFALDAFGTGYSSLTYLKRLPVAEIKIDQSFVRDMLHDPEDLGIVEGLLNFATAFHRRVVAEGVESTEHGALLLQLGCERAQGHAIAPPLPAAELPGWATGWQACPAWRGLPPISRDDLPLLIAGIEHRAWIDDLESHLGGKREAPPALDHRLCRFGQWLEGAGLCRHGQHAAFQAIGPVHRRTHDLAAELLELKAHQQDTQPKLDELHRLRDELLELLPQLLLESQRL